MSDPSWRVDDVDDEPTAAPSTNRALVSLHFLLTALQRRWRVWVGLGCVGMLLGLAWAVTTPHKSVGTVTLVLAHDPVTDPQQAMSTDVAFLRTRTLGVDIVDQLGLDMSPEAFQQSVVSNAVSTDVLVLEVSGPEDAGAVARAKALGDNYLEFRESQIRSQLDALTRGYRERVASLKQELEDLGRQYDALPRTTPEDERRAGELLNLQAQVTTEIQTTQQSIQAAVLKSTSIIDASHVLDPASLKPGPSAARVLLLQMAAGFIGGTAVGMGIVLGRALLSDRLRLREEVALALGAPVRVSVGTLHPRPSWWPSRTTAAPSPDLRRLVHAIEVEIPCLLKEARETKDAREGMPREDPGRAAPTQLALASIDNVEVAELVIATLAARLTAEGLRVFVVDLSEAGGLDAALRNELDQQEQETSASPPVLFRPDGVPSLAFGPVGHAMTISTELSLSDPRRRSWNEADVALILVEVDPAVGVEHVSSWADRVVVLVTAGRSSAERLRTTAELIRTAGLRLLFAMMVGADHTDESLGLPDAMDNNWPQAARTSQ